MSNPAHEHRLTRLEFGSAVCQAYEDPAEIPADNEIDRQYRRYLLYFDTVGIHVESAIPPDGSKKVAVLAF